VSPARCLEAEYHAWGHSCVSSPYGEIIAVAGFGEEIIYADIGKEILEAYSVDTLLSGS